MGAPALPLTTHQPQFQEEADSVGQSLAKLSSRLDTQYSPGPGGPSGALTELLRQLEVRRPHPPATRTHSWGRGLPVCVWASCLQGTPSSLEPQPQRQEKGVRSSRRSLVCSQQALPTAGPPFPHLLCGQDCPEEL